MKTLDLDLFFILAKVLITINLMLGFAFLTVQYRMHTRRICTTAKTQQCKAKKTIDFSSFAF